jgi:hypothetical protein
VRRFTYETEGWGLTYDGKMLIMSDGSSDLTYLDPVTFSPVRKLAVTMNGRPVENLNELEFIEGTIWSNVWQTDLILCIDPGTGHANSYLNLRGILPDKMRTGSEDVLNGIAYDARQKRIFVSGKLCARILEIAVKKPASAIPSTPGAKRPQFRNRAYPVPDPWSSGQTQSTDRGRHRPQRFYGHDAIPVLHGILGPNSKPRLRNTV